MIISLNEDFDIKSGAELSYAEYPQRFNELLNKYFSAYIHDKVALYWNFATERYHPEVINFHIEGKLWGEDRLTRYGERLSIMCSFVSIDDHSECQLELFTGVSETYETLVQSVSFSRWVETGVDEWIIEYRIKHSASMEAGKETYLRVDVVNRSDINEFYSKLPPYVSSLNILSDRDNMPEHVTLGVNGTYIRGRWVTKGDERTIEISADSGMDFDDTASTPLDLEYKQLITYYLTQPIE